MKSAAATTPLSQSQPAYVPMRPGRVWLVYGIVAVLVLGHLAEVARQSEHWPFSNYPMWATVAREWDVKQILPVGVSQDDPAEEVPLTDPAYFAPMPIYYQRLSLERAARKRRDDMLRDYLAHYERRREEKLHAGPALGGIRVYELSWRMKRDASNAATPEGKVLLYEYPARAGATTRPARGEGGGGR